MKTFKSIIENEAQQPYYKALHEFVEEEYASKTIFPPHNHILHAFNFCDYEDIKVVIIGQDPYHELHQANGLAFSVNKGVRTPPSLVNIYKEAHADVGIDIPNHGDLTSWAKQGVLFFNNRFIFINKCKKIIITNRLIINTNTIIVFNHIRRSKGSYMISMSI